MAERAVNITDAAIDAKIQEARIHEERAATDAKDTGDYDQAEKYIGPAAQQMPRNATVQEHMGDVLAKRGRWQDAIAAWSRALEAQEGEVNKKPFKDLAAYATDLKNQGKLDLNKPFEMVIEAESELIIAQSLDRNRRKKLRPHVSVRDELIH